MYPIRDLDFASVADPESDQADRVSLELEHLEFHTEFVVPARLCPIG